MNMQPRTVTREPRIPTQVAGAGLRFVWQAVRLPVYGFLVIVEPLVRFGLAATALLGVVVAFLFEFSGVAPRFPFWQTIAISVGCVLTLGAYYAVMRLFSK